MNRLLVLCQSVFFASALKPETLAKELRASVNDSFASVSGFRKKSLFQRSSRALLIRKRINDRRLAGNYRVLCGLVVVASALLAGCATYQIGADTLYSADVQTVHVPIFQSASFRRGLGERLTEAVIKEIELRTPYKVVGDPSRADTVLSGRIVDDSKKVLFEDRADQPREFELEMVVEVSWVDRRGNILRQATPIPVSGNVVDVSQTTTLVPEGGQSVVTAQQHVINGLASQIVNIMETPW